MNISNYFFYFDSTDFIYTGTGALNIPLLTFSKGNVAGYTKNNFGYLKKFASYSFNNRRMNEAAYHIMALNENFTDENIHMPVSALKI